MNFKGYQLENHASILFIVILLPTGILSEDHKFCRNFSTARLLSPFACLDQQHLFPHPL